MQGALSQKKYDLKELKNVKTESEIKAEEDKFKSEALERITLNFEKIKNSKDAIEEKIKNVYSHDILTPEKIEAGNKQKAELEETKQKYYSIEEEKQKAIENINMLRKKYGSYANSTDEGRRAYYKLEDLKEESKQLESNQSYLRKQVKEFEAEKITSDYIQNRLNKVTKKENIETQVKAAEIYKLSPTELLKRAGPNSPYGLDNYPALITYVENNFKESLEKEAGIAISEKRKPKIRELSAAEKFMADPVEQAKKLEEVKNIRKLQDRTTMTNSEKRTYDLTGYAIKAAEITKGQDVKNQTFMVQAKLAALGTQALFKLTKAERKALQKDGKVPHELALAAEKLGIRVEDLGLGLLSSEPVTPVTEEKPKKLTPAEKKEKKKTKADIADIGKNIYNIEQSIIKQDADFQVKLEELSKKNLQGEAYSKELAALTAENEKGIVEKQTELEGKKATFETLQKNLSDIKSANKTKKTQNKSLEFIPCKTSPEGQVVEGTHTAKVVRTNSPAGGPKKELFTQEYIDEKVAEMTAMSRATSAEAEKTRLQEKQKIETAEKAKQEEYLKLVTGPIPTEIKDLSSEKRMELIESSVKLNPELYLKLTDEEKVKLNENKEALVKTEVEARVAQEISELPKEKQAALTEDNKALLYKIHETQVASNLKPYSPRMSVIENNPSVTIKAGEVVLQK